MFFQWFSFILSLVLIGLNVYHYCCNPKRKWALIFWLLFWGTLAGFYAGVLFTDYGMHEVSKHVRFFRNSTLAIWYIMHKYGKHI